MIEPIESFKKRLNQAMSAKNMRPVELAEKCNISKSTISHYMSGYTEPKSNRLYIIAEVLDVNEAWLMGLDVPMERGTKSLLVDSKQAFLTYIDSLGYHIHRDDPEHKPFIRVDDILVRLKHDTLDSLKLRIDSYTKASIDSEILSLKEEQIKEERLEKERLVQHLLNAAHKRTDAETTDEMEKHDDDIMNDDEWR